MRDQSPYRALPDFYDAVMAHVDYEAWGRYLQRLWSREGLQPHSILEIAAGTCALHRTGAYPESARTVYTDLSAAMLNAPKKKRITTPSAWARPGLSPLPDLRACCNAIALPFRTGDFDLVVMVYDAFNYLMDKRGALACLQEAARVLKPGGLFIFDVTTRTNSLRHFTDFLDIEELPGATLIRRSTFDSESDLQQNAFTIFVEESDGRFRREEETHQQRVFALQDVAAWAEQAGFEVRGRFAGFSMKPGAESSERVHFVLKKP